MHILCACVQCSRIAYVYCIHIYTLVQCFFFLRTPPLCEISTLIGHNFSAVFPLHAHYPVVCGKTAKGIHVPMPTRITCAYINILHTRIYLHGIHVCTVFITSIIANHLTTYPNIVFLLQGHSGDKGQKGDSSAPNFDIYAAVKVKKKLHKTFILTYFPFLLFTVIRLFSIFFFFHF